MRATIIIVIPILFLLTNCGQAQPQPLFSTKIVAGSQQTCTYTPLLLNKNVAVVGNQSSLVGKTHLVDTLLGMGVKVVKIFCPEHGFRGTADAGSAIGDSMDSKTGLQIVSLYGKRKKPTASDLQGVDIMVFDIQDVGVRFYTYISTLHYIMEACAENYIPVLVLDRPNPNGFYVDGPVLDTAARSFVGMHPVPIVYGMTIGEYALMINGEHWLKNGGQCQLSVIPCKNYTHQTLYKLPVRPSPNLPNIRSVLLYPSLGLFEGTVVSVGRGTPFPFQVFGHPHYKKGSFKFTPTPGIGAAHPKLEGRLCKGTDLRNLDLARLASKKQINVGYLIQAYNNLNRDTVFFNSYFYRLAGCSRLQQQVEQGLTEKEIRESWQRDIEDFMAKRGKYLLYE